MGLRAQTESRHLLCRVSSLQLADHGTSQPPQSHEPAPIINLLLQIYIYPTGSVSWRILTNSNKRLTPFILFCPLYAAVESQAFECGWRDTLPRAFSVSSRDGRPQLSGTWGLWLQLPRNCLHGSFLLPWHHERPSACLAGRLDATTPWSLFKWQAELLLPGGLPAMPLHP